MDIYTLKFTLDQVNDIIACMRDGPYGRVNNIIQDFNRQLQAQVKKPEEAPPPKANGEAQATNGKAEGVQA